VTGKRQNQRSYERRKAKQTERRRPHIDKYAPQASGTKAADPKPETNNERR
jgi:hypothetical protein